MTTDKNKSLIPEALMEEVAKETLIQELSVVYTKPGDFFPDAEAKKKAEEAVASIAAKGKLFEFLEKTMPEPCPTCGHLPGW